MTDERFNRITEAGMTLVFLGFAWVMRAEEGASGLSNLIVGGVITHWFGEAKVRAVEARQDRQRRRERR